MSVELTALRKDHQKIQSLLKKLAATNDAEIRARTRLCDKLGRALDSQSRDLTRVMRKIFKFPRRLRKVRYREELELLSKGVQPLTDPDVADQSPIKN